MSLTGLPTKKMAAKLTGVPLSEVAKRRRYGRSSCLVSHVHNQSKVFFLKWDENKRRWLNIS
jgi:hypothetical protein